MYSAFQVMQLNILIRIESEHNQKIVANEFEKEQFAIIKGNLCMHCF